MPLLRAGFLLTTLFSAAIASADVVPRLEITPYVGYRGGGHLLDAVDEADFEYNLSYGFVANYRATFNTQWELIYGHQATDIDDSAASADGSKLGLNLDYLHVGGTYVFGDKPLAPFLSIAVGATRLSPDAAGISSETYFSASAGLGLRYTLTQNLGLRLEGRALGLFGKTDSLVFCETFDGVEECFLSGDGSIIPQFELSAGLSFRF
ncbi:MAG: outer membrane beta-barrel protein [Gammaproteobacteria bacterium]